MGIVGASIAIEAFNAGRFRMEVFPTRTCSRNATDEIKKYKISEALHSAHCRQLESKIPK